MIAVTPVPEPAKFDELARRPGKSWLEANENRRPTDRWTPFLGDLQRGFRSLCGYSSMHLPYGSIDHYRSCKNHRHLAYEWSNYRFVAGWINSAKGTLDEQVLDPYEIQEGWFEILWPSLQLVVAPSIDPAQRARAEYTIERLHLRDDERIVRVRQAWSELYVRGELTLNGLWEVAPLIARAVVKHGVLGRSPGKIE